MLVPFAARWLRIGEGNPTGSVDAVPIAPSSAQLGWTIAVRISTFVATVLSHAMAKLPFESGATETRFGKSSVASWIWFEAAAPAGLSARHSIVSPGWLNAFHTVSVVAPLVATAGVL